MKKSFGSLLWMMGVALVSAATLQAREIQVTGVTAWSTILPVPTTADEVVVSQGATLYVDVPNALIGKLTVGSGGVGGTSGTVLFDNTSRKLTVSGDVLFGSDNPGNLLNLSVLTIEHTLEVGGRLFPVTGAGTFNPGLGSVVYNAGGDQVVSAKIGTATIQYKHLTLKGSGTKTIESGVVVQGNLSIQDAAKVAGSPVTYGALASLEYKGGAAQTTTGAEWPSPLFVQVTIDNTFGVKLDATKTLAQTLTIRSGALNTDGKDLVVLGNVVNAGSLVGAGRLVLGGSVSQSLTGAGTYGNLVVDNLAGAVTDAGGLSVQGRLNIARGRVTLPAGAAGVVKLLSYNGIDQSAPGTYGSSGSGATYKSDTFWAGTGVVTLAATKFDSLVTLSPVPTNVFSDATVTFSGKVTGGDFGNGPRDGESVTVTIVVAPLPIVKNVSTTGGDGSFSVVFDTATLPAGNYQVSYQYAGGINLAPAVANRTPGFVIKQKPVTATPIEVSKIYGNPDPALLIVVDPPNALVPGDNFTGSLARVPGESAGTYEIIQGTLSLPANYLLTVTTGKKLTINKRPLTVTAIPRTKVYGSADPSFAANVAVTLTPPTLVGADQVAGALGRAAGETVNNYLLNLGTFRIDSTVGGDNYAISFIPANLGITKKSVEISVAPANLQKIFGQADPAFTPIFTPVLAQPPGAAAADTASGVLKRASGENATSYAINMGTLKIVNGTTDVTANYDLSIATGSQIFTIHRKAVTISALATKNVTYGAQPSTYLSSLIVYTGLVAPATTTATPATIETWTPSTPVASSVPGTYKFTVKLDSAADSNYDITYGVRNGDLVIGPAALTVQAENKTMLESGSVFPESGFTATYNWAVATDNVGNSLTGGPLKWTGSATTATTAGTYIIDPGTTGYSSTKYTVGYATGLLVITKGIGKTTLEGPQVWPEGGSLSWQINQANGGSAGANPGWTLVDIKAGAGGTAGSLDITATPANPYKIYLTTLAGSQAGSAAKFDPSRPYRWKFVQTAGGINQFAANKFQIVWNGLHLFTNPIFGGGFGIEADANNLYITYTPKAQSTVDANGLLAHVLGSDVDVLYAEPLSTLVTPQETVTIAVKVGNLKQPIYGAQAYLKFDSTFFVSSQTGDGAPVVVAGGGIWDRLIYNIWQGDGKLDTVIGLQFNLLNGTVSPGTVAYITLTPTKTATGKSRLIFRADDDTIGLPGGSFLSAASGGTVLPARVPTSDIEVKVDTTGPVLSNLSAVQTQYGLTQNVLNGPSATGDPAYATNSVRGAVKIAVTARDLPGVGLKQQPTVTLVGPGGAPTVTANCINPGSADGTYNYEWAVDGATANGKWSGTITAVDLANPSKTTSTNFFLGVNKNEVTGIVELDAFRGSQRVVTFQAGTGSAVSKTWDLNLDFTGTLFYSAGSFRELPSFAAAILAPNNPTGVLLRYGSIADLSAIVTRILSGTDNLAGDLRDWIFGYIVDVNALKDMAAKLKAPVRSVDDYIYGRLSANTRAALAAFNLTNPTTAQIAALNDGLLDDFSVIVIGVNIYNPLRFASVAWPADTAARITELLGKPTLTAAETAELNRLLLNAAYTGYEYGTLSPWTAPALLSYAGGADDTLAGLLLGDFDTLTLMPASLYSEVRFLGIPLRPATQALVLTTPPVTGNELVRLNRMLIEDGVATALGSLNFSSGLLTPATLSKVRGYVAVPPTETKANTEAALVADLNAVMTAGKLTRSTLETAFNQITPSKWLAPYTLIHVPDAATLVSAKTAWNVREKLGVSGLPNAVANFVSDGLTPSTFDVDDHYLRAGDITTDNAVSLADYQILQSTYLNATGDVRADINGTGSVNFDDFKLMQTRFGVVGDTAVDKP